MRPFVQVKTISLYVERLGEATKLLEPLKEVTERGKSWLEETEENSLTFIQMCQILDEVSSSFGQKMAHFLSQDGREQCVDQRTSIKETSAMTSENYNLLLKRLEEAEERINSLSQESLLMGSKNNEMCSEIKDIVTKLGNKSNEIEVQFETLSEKYVSLQHNLHQQEKVLEDVKETVTKTLNMESKNSEKVEECWAKISETTAALTTIKLQVNSLSASEEQLEARLKINPNAENNNSFSQKIEELTQDVKNATQSHKNLSEKITADHKQCDMRGKLLYQLFSKRLAPLETLQSVFNKTLEARERHMEMINMLSRKITYLETQSNSTIAFTAEVKEYKFFKQGMVIRKYWTCMCDEGNYFNKESGEFTAPVDGVYLVSASIDEYNGKGIHVGIYVKTPYQQKHTLIGVTNSNDSKHTACSVNVADIKAGEKIFLKIDYIQDGAELSKNSIFTCIKL